MIIGVISDTHGLLRPEAVEALRDCELIIHAGDVGAAEILDRLRDIAPTVAVRGNVDTQSWARRLPLTEVVQADQLHLYVLHDLAALDVDPKAAGIAAVISGHSHKPVAETRDGVLFLNPGSAGPCRFRLPICLARLRLTGHHLDYDFINLDI